MRGRYNTITNYLSKIAFEIIKKGYELNKKEVKQSFTVGPEEEDSDIPSNDFEFDFEIYAEYSKDLYKVDGGANAGFDDDGDPIQPFLRVKFIVPENPDWQEISMDLKDAVRHELEHLTQEGDNLRPGKYLQDDQFIRNLIKADLLPKADYFKLEKEIDAMLQGLYFKAKKSKKPFFKVIDTYLDTQDLSPEDRRSILKIWRKRNRALNLPRF